MKSILGILLLLSCGSVLSKDFLSSSITVSDNTLTLIGQDSDEDDIELEGTAFEANWEFAEGTLLRLRHSKTSIDSRDEFGSEQFDIIERGIGLAISEKTKTSMTYSFLDFTDYQYVDRETFCMGTSCETFSDKGSIVDGVWDIGVGYQFEVNDYVRLGAELSHVRWDGEDSGDDIAMTRTTLNMALSPRFPVGLNLEYSKLDRLGEELKLGVTLLF
ncbi:MAG: hypothetical protein HWE27_15175 [Gammaproteobacteria bacterium]|nr:hypothetical protein [Gammaproteobacteria bacterium]